MKELPAEANLCVRLGGPNPGWCAIKGVADDRMTNRGEMNADLVGSTGFNLYSNKRKPAERRVELFKYFVVADR
jgi:hypothetical protein